MNQEELYNLIKTEQPNICQIVAYKNGDKVYSECWNDYKPNDAVHIMSATKSIMALLIGIAIHRFGGVLFGNGCGNTRKILCC